MNIDNIRILKLSVSLLEADIMVLVMKSVGILKVIAYVPYIEL